MTTRRARPPPSHARASSKPEILVGISGFRYPEWRSVFYPPGLPHRAELEFASRAVRTIEINGSFYSLGRPSSYQRWYAETPADYVVAVKGGAFITHNKKLVDCHAPLANFFASGVLALEDKLGPILWQLPAQLSFDADRIESFFASLPRTTAAAATLARDHDARLKNGAYVDVRADVPIRYALEPRHPSFGDPKLRAILQKYDVALAVADSAGKFPMFDPGAASHVYVRLHGSRELYVSGYTSVELDAWARKVEAWARRGDVYVYFDNDADVHAPFDAINLAARLGYGERVPFPRARMRSARAHPRAPRRALHLYSGGRSSRASAPRT